MAETKTRDTSKYVCRVCQITGVKLWRFLSSSDVDLHCATCACKEEKHEEYVIDEQGQRIASDGGFFGSTTDQIGSYGPAIIDFDGTYWGYCASSRSALDAHKWWVALPTYGIKATSG